MRFTALYVRSRLAGRTVAVLFVVALATWLWVQWTGSSAVTLTLLPLTMPLAAAAIIGASTGSPFGESEATASRPLGMLRAGHPMGLLLIAGLALALAGTWWNVPDGAWILVRNLAGFTGLALLTARVLGSGLSWVIPLGYAVLSLLTPPAGDAPAWAWVVRAATDREAAVIAFALLLAGLAIAALSHTRSHRVEMAS